VASPLLRLEASRRERPSLSLGNAIALLLSRSPRSLWSCQRCLRSSSSAISPVHTVLVLLLNISSDAAVRRGELLKTVAALGREFVHRGMHVHAAKLRLYYVALRRGWASSHRSKVDVHWSEDLVIEWCKILQLPPYQHAYPIRAPHSRYSRCKDRSNNEGGSFQTESTFPGGWKVRCSNCGEVWLVLETKSTSA